MHRMVIIIAALLVVGLTQAAAAADRHRPLPTTVMTEETKGAHRRRPRTRAEERGSEYRERNSQDGVCDRKRGQEDHREGTGKIIIPRADEAE